MEQLGKIPATTLTDREILLLTYQQLQVVNGQFDQYRTESDKQQHEIEIRLRAVEKQINESEVIKRQDDKRGKRQVSMIGVCLAILQIIIGIVISIIAKK